jgi:hypothetical protein
MGYHWGKDWPMTINNTALYDAALATIADSNGAWLTSPATGSYASQANAAVAVATEIDAAIPAVPGGATITKAIMTGRSPTNTTPSTYASIAAAIGDIFAEYKTRLLNNDVGGGGGGTLQNLSNVIFVDGTTIITTPNQTGNIEAPFALLSSAIAAVPSGGTIFITPHDYTAQGTITITKNLTLKGLGGLYTFSAITVSNAVTAEVNDALCTGIFTAGSGCQITLNNTSVGNGYSGTGSLLTTKNGSRIFTGIECDDITADGSLLSGSIILHDIGVTLTNTSVPSVILTFAGAAGTVSMDGYTYDNWLTQSAVVANGKAIVINSLPNVTLPVNVPALVVGQLGYVDVSVAATDIAGITQDTPVAASPTADLATGGTGSPGFYINSRVSATNIVRMAFMGQFDSPQTVDFTIVKLDAK